MISITIYRKDPVDGLMRRALTLEQHPEKTEVVLVCFEDSIVEVNAAELKIAAVFMEENS